MDDYRIGGGGVGVGVGVGVGMGVGVGVGVGGGGGGGQMHQAGQMQQQGSVEDFPALPRTQSGSLVGLDERSLAGLGPRQAMSSRLLPHLDGLMAQQQQQQPPMASGDVERKVGSSPGRAGQGRVGQRIQKKENWVF